MLAKYKELFIDFSSICLDIFCIFFIPFLEHFSSKEILSSFWHLIFTPNFKKFNNIDFFVTCIFCSVSSSGIGLMLRTDLLQGSEYILLDKFCKISKTIVYSGYTITKHFLENSN
ncbi:hypothetical protein BpHYR1_031470 [Brachionus plicatilis]|uniref:Uncharacterized protein n=1 Tax=Brachionus plicatilis TaxID=10195 RepID=A0A3M7RM10_BRAPC|nr:hypothetical protein BpHYR1_031470 [Brachionus plicatilis]